MDVYIKATLMVDAYSELVESNEEFKGVRSRQA